jgi:Cu-Zn family superoxide dismutase
MLKLTLALAAVAGFGVFAQAKAATVLIPMALATPTGPGASIGVITANDAPGGVTLFLDLHDLPPGPHGFHVHANPSCAPVTAPTGAITPAGAAGAHLDPAMTGTHMGPMGMGHLGDLPRIEVNARGEARATLQAPRIASVADLKGHALMIHAGGDNYTDTPPLGGGGARLACGVVH